MSVAAPPALVLRRRSTLEPLALDPSLELGAGGEARVFAVPGDRTLVAKIYHHPTVERARKVALMIGEPPELHDPHAVLAWPVDLLLGGGGGFAGFLMRRAEGPRLFELYNPITRRRSGESCDHGMLHRAGAHLAAAFDAVHARGYVVGDVNESNVLLGADGGVTLVDTDSFQVRDPEDGTVHRSKVGKAEFTPPELQGRAFADFDRTPEHDRFGLAVLLFLALMEGTHPFAGRMETRAETPPVEERIRRGLFAHHGHPEIKPPRLAPPFSILDPDLQALFVRSFVDGHADPSARPTAAEWRTALAAAEARLETCGANPRHRFGAHVDACPWCERTKLLHGRDPFPADPHRVADEIRNAPKPVRVPSRAAPAAAPTPVVVQAPPVRRMKLVIPTNPVFTSAPWAARGNTVLAALAGWTTEMLGPNGLRSPVAQAVPLLGMCILGPPQLQLVAGIAFLLTIGRIPKGGIEPIEAPTVHATAILCVAAFYLSSLFGGSAAVPHASTDPPYAGFADGGTDRGGPADDVPDGVRRVVITPPYTRETVDRAPELLNHTEIEDRLAREYMEAGETPAGRGEILLGVHLRPGEERPDSVYTWESSDPLVTAVAARVAGEMRFVPLTADDEPVGAWVWLPIRFDRAGVR